MSAFDFSPLFRTAIGFDRMARQLDAARLGADGNGYPPYNIERTGEDSYVLTMAVAGFGPEDLDIVARDSVLSITGKAPGVNEGRQFLHRGIAGRAFERRFVLADHMLVEGANLEHGLLHVSLRRQVPESLKPRRIEVQPGRPALPANEQAVPVNSAAA